MTIEYIRYELAAGTATAFEQAYEQAVLPMAESSHCVDYELSRCVEEPTSYVLRIRWDSLEGHMQGFRTSPEFRRFFTHIQPYVDAIEEMRHYEPVLEGTGCANDGGPARKL